MEQNNELLRVVMGTVTVYSVDWTEMQAFIVQEVSVAS